MSTLCRYLGLNEVPQLNNDQAWSLLLDGKASLQLADGLELRRVRVMDDYRIELLGFSSGMRERLKAYGLTHEIIAWKLRFFVPVGPDGPPYPRPADRAPSPRRGHRPRRRVTEMMMMTRSSIADLARDLTRHAEAVCRHYLSNGRRQGRYWLVGDLDNASGRSLYVRLFGPDFGKGAAEWTDAATGGHGDLLDLIRHNLGLSDVHQAAAEARRFLSLPQAHEHVPHMTNSPAKQTDAAKRLAAKRLWAMSGPLLGTHAAAYLEERGIVDLTGTETSLRFHPACFYRHEDGTRSTLPAMIAAVTNESFAIHGVHRTWLDPSQPSKADVEHPRRAMGALFGKRRALRLRSAKPRRHRRR